MKVLVTGGAGFIGQNLVHAWRANPAGSLLAPTCAALIPWLLVSAALGRPWGCRSLDRPLTLLVVATVALSLLAWTFRLLLRRVL